MSTAIGLISDIHATAAPVREALSLFKDKGVNIILCAGDIAGYGDELDETVEILIESQCQSILGNHDLWYLDTCNSNEGRVAAYLKQLPPVLELTIEGTGKGTISTGIPFLDHMLTLTTAHGLFDLKLSAKGDVDVDGHHTVEDIGIVLGEAFNKALGDRKGIRRYGRGLVPMDEALASVVIDFSNWPVLVFHVDFKRESTGLFDVELVKEFFKAFADKSGATVHINLMYGRNTHHMIEAIYKAFGQALDEATLIDERIKGVRSTKGVL